jgi:ribosomal protein S21
MMGNAVRVRVEINSKEEDRGHAFKKLHVAFKRACKDYGIIKSLKRYQSYESESRRKRKKRKEAELAILKNKLNENFNNG